MKFNTSLHQLNNSATNLVSARDIHTTLESGQQFGNWIDNRIAQGGFIENTDYILLTKTIKQNSTIPNTESQVITDGSGGHNKVEYFITPDMAKHLGMMERTANGVRVRQYFIDVEKEANKPTFQPQQSPLIGLKSDEVQASLMVAETVSRVMNLPESGRLLTFQRALEPLGLTHILPCYGIDTRAAATSGSSQVTFAATTLLKGIEPKLSAFKFNKLCINAGILEDKTRPSTKHPDKVKGFKAITKLGERFGKNVVSPNNPRETSPHWYEDSFPDLLNLIGAN